MAITVDEAVAELNLDDDDDIDVGAELGLYVDAANEWVALKVADLTRAAASPNVIRLATLFLVDHLWEAQRGPATQPLPGDEVVVVAGKGYAIPNRVRELLQPFTARTEARGSFPTAGWWPDPVEPGRRW